MTNPTTNFGWVMPTATDLVTDLPADFNVFGQGVDTSMADLLGGTTGQILSKTSATNMDFTWVTSAGDIEGVTAGIGISGGGTSGTVTVTNSMATAIDAKGDLVAGTGADAFSRLAVGTNNYVLTADSAQATGLKWAAATSAAPSFSLLSTTSLTTGTTYSITGLSGYNQLLININAVTTTSADSFNYTLNNVTTSSYATARNFMSGTGAGAVSLGSSGSTITNMGSTSNNGAAIAVSGSYLIDGANSSGFKSIKGQVGANSSALVSNNTVFTSGIFTDTAVVSSFQINCTFGTFNGGTVTIYGSVI